MLLQFTNKYIEYLKSEEWKKKAALIRRIDNYTCQICRFDARNNIGGRPDHGHLEVHHLTYKRLYSEWTVDLVTLCKGCHADVTNIKNAENISRDDALDIVCRKFGIEPAQFQEQLIARSKENAVLIDKERFFTPKPTAFKKKRKKVKQHKEKTQHVYFYGVIGLTRNGLCYDNISAKIAATNNRFGQCKRFTSKKQAQQWVKYGMKELRRIDYSKMPKTYTQTGYKNEKQNIIR